jgi:hypothetical protein
VPVTICIHPLMYVKPGREQLSHLKNVDADKAGYNNFIIDSPCNEENLLCNYELALPPISRSAQFKYKVQSHKS